MTKIITGFTAILAVFLVSIYAIFNIHSPYCRSIVKKAKGVYEQYQAAQDTGSMALELKKIHEDIIMVDSLLQRQIIRESEVKNNLVEALYLFADSSHLKTSKVEVGERLIVGNRYETAISINGTGEYLSLGKFIEKIENYPKSTRVRQIVLKVSEKKDIEGFVDFVLME